MSKRVFALPALALTAGLAATIVPTAAQAGTTASGAAQAGTTASGAAQIGTSDFPVARRTPPAAYFTAHLTGAGEVRAKGGPAVGDRNGGAYAVIRVSGDEISYAVRWRNIAAPTAFHLHQGRAGRNGDVRAGFFGEALPKSARAVTGTVGVGGGLSAAIRRNPGGFYLNIHTRAFPGGAVRAQLHRLRHPVELNSVLVGGTHPTLQAKAVGCEEVPAPGKKVGDPNGLAQWLIEIKGTKLNYATDWNRISTPTDGHVHRGRKGKNGPLVVDLFADAGGLPTSITGIAGTVGVKRGVAKRLLKNPKGWYANLHTTEFGGGAVRGQFHRARR